jgi:hypothetical protein
LVKPLLPLIAAGGTFAAAAIVGLLIGVAFAGRRGEPLFAPIGLLLGAAVGAYSAVRVLSKSMR